MTHAQKSKSRSQPFLRGALLAAACFAPLAAHPAPAPQSQEAQIAAKKKEMSVNDARVQPSEECAGLFVPVVREERESGVLAVWAAYFLNTSDKRYKVLLDVTYQERGNTMVDRSTKTYTVEKEYTVRPDTFTKFLLFEKGSAAYQITAITKIVVLGCEGR